MNSSETPDTRYNQCTCIRDRIFCISGGNEETLNEWEFEVELGEAHGLKKPEPQTPL